MSREPRIAIVTEEPGWHGTELRRALESRGAEVRMASLRDSRLDVSAGGARVVMPGFEQRPPDGVIVRDVPGGTLEQVILRLDVLHALRELGVPVYNDARVIERTVDKGMTSFLLRRAGLHVPETTVTGSLEQARTFVEAASRAGHDVVVKPLFGSLGVGLRRLTSGMDVPGAAECRGVWYLQHFVAPAPPAEGWHDWRVLVVGGEAIAAMVRRGMGWISNVAQGARCEPAELDRDLIRQAVVATAAVAADYAGVDLIRDAEGQLQVLEVNGIPAWKGLQSVTSFDIADRVAEDFLSRRLGAGNGVGR